MIAHAVDDFDNADDAAELLFGRRTHAKASFDLVVAERLGITDPPDLRSDW
jgi:hypothetical protein